MSDVKTSAPPETQWGEALIGKEMALVESRTFWAAALGLAAVIAQVFGWQSIVTFTSDPASADKILQAVMMIAGFGAILFTRLSRGPVTSILPRNASDAASGVASVLALSLVALMCLGLSACNTPQGQDASTGATPSFGQAVAADVNAITGALSSPAANQAAANIRIGATAFVCAVSSISNLTNQISTEIGAGHALIKNSGNVYVISKAICGALQGVVTGSEPVAPTATTAIPAS